MYRIPTHAEALVMRRHLTPTMVHVLLCLTDGERHGYAIKLEVERRTHGDVRLGPGTLYETIQRLERSGLVRPVARASEALADRPRRYYRLTPQGLAALRTEIARLEQLVDHARRLERLKGVELA
jgi:DNA-binding PadR family transcriptional regulator